MAINDITGDTIASKHLSGDAKRRFDESFDRIFGKPSDGQCKKCGGILIREDERLKCEACGWSNA